MYVGVYMALRILYFDWTNIMQKKMAVLLCVLAPLFALLAYSLRVHEINSIFHPETGLADLWQMPSFLLMGLSAFVAALFFLLSRTVPKQMHPKFKRAFGELSAITGLLSLLGVFVLLASAFATFGHVTGLVDLGFFIAWAIGGVLSGFCLMLYPILGARGKNVSILAAIPVFWLCMWLVLAHIRYAADPVLLRYVYYLFAIAFLLLALYFIASAAFTKGKAPQLLFSAGMAVYFSGIAFADARSLQEHIIIGALALFVLSYSLLLLRHMKRSPEVSEKGE